MVSSSACRPWTCLTSLITYSSSGTLITGSTLARYVCCQLGRLSTNSVPSVITILFCYQRRRKKPTPEEFRAIVGYVKKAAYAQVRRQMMSRDDCSCIAFGFSRDVYSFKQHLLIPRIVLWLLPV